MAKQLTGLTTLNWCGASISEPIPPRLLLLGHNGAGKTARLRAIDWGIRGPQGKNYFLPYASGDVCAITTRFDDDAFHIIRRSEADGNGRRNTQCVFPSRGEKTLAAVAARVEKELAPNLFVLNLPKWLDSTGSARRRGLLALLTEGSETKAETARKALDEQIGDNPVWKKLSDPESKTALPVVGDVFAYLQTVETAARNIASAARDQKRSAEGVLRETPPTGVKAGKPRAEIEERVKELDGEVQNATAAREKALALADRLKRLQRAEDSERQWIYVNAKKIETADLPPELSVEDFAQWPPGQLVEWADAELREMGKRVEVLDKEASDFTEERDRHVQAISLEKSAIAEDSGRVAAMYGLLGLSETDKPIAIESCPLCGNEDYDSDDLNGQIVAVKKRIERSRNEVLDHEAAKRELDARLSKLDDATLAMRDDRQIVDGIRERAKLLEINAKEAAEAKKDDAAAVLNDEDFEALVASRDKLIEELQTLSREEGRRATLAGARENVAKSEALEKAAKELQRFSGPQGLAGEFLAELTLPLETRLQEIFRDTFPNWWFELELDDVRGKPDARLTGRKEGGERVDFAALSGGQQATALAAFIAALAERAPDRTNICLVEAGEIHYDALLRLLHSLGKVKELSNVIVASPLTMLVDDGADDRVVIEAAGWTVRHLTNEGPVDYPIR